MKTGGRWWGWALGLALTVGVASGAMAQTVVTKTLNFDDPVEFTDGRILDDVNLGGVTFSTASSPVPVEVYRNSRRDTLYHSPSGSIGAINTDGFSARITAVFDRPSSFVSVWGGDEGVDLDFIAMDVFDADSGGTKLATVSFVDNVGPVFWNGNPYKPLEYVSGSRNIRRVELYRVQLAAPHNLGVAWDDFSFDYLEDSPSAVPEPGGLALLMPAMTAIALCLRRKQSA